MGKCGWEGVDGLVEAPSKSKVSEVGWQFADWLIERATKSEVGEC